METGGVRSGERVFLAVVAIVGEWGVAHGVYGRLHHDFVNIFQTDRCACGTNFFLISGCAHPGVCGHPRRRGPQAKA